MLAWLLKWFRRTPVAKCEKCGGCKYVANTCLQEPWSQWQNVKRPDYIQRIPCPECNQYVEPT